ncbi:MULTISPECIES: hypothetical protein [Chryseobacterium]|uniref:hypothetical protein n=1 Tax=Chryseobacterium TaxID=59732 RepID=UPI000FB75F11|nr:MULTISPECIES: hypothetical protein [Chryseobacterium]MBM7420368.1 hypothetical protein [Chryseobacterium sp. JUb44]MDH6210315.1 hypothetical protein [Chryseobacterium sp. BIGb0186]WSO09025.1 hypothetical protein VUJ64_14445 [Chryseobacterium scophthalmum]
MKKILFLAVLCSIAIYKAQGVGIGNTNPTQTLDVTGNMKLSEELYFENPGTYTGPSTNSYLVVRDNSDKALKRYVPATSEYSAINSTVYHITNITPGGIADFDTKIPTSKYYLIIGGFIVRGVSDNSNIKITQDTTTSQYIPQYSARSFELNGTWHIRFVPNNNRVFHQNPEVRLSVSVYRKDMLTTVNPTITFNMNAATSGNGSAPTPALP